MGLAGHVAAVIVAALVAGARGCPRDCTCRWKGGKETVECIEKGLTSIPEGIASGTQVLDLSGNFLVSVRSEAFRNASLLNLQRIYLAHCHLKQIDEGTFSRLTNLVDLDLGHNSLGAVPSKTFTDCPALRRLVLSGNPISRLDSNAFAHLPYLTTLEMSQCQVRLVAPKAFDGLNALTHLKLDGNQLTSLKGSVVVALPALHDAALHGNPWRCDCALREMRAWLVKERVPCPVPPVCEQPPRVRGLALDRVDPSELACEPKGDQLGDVNVVANRDAVLVCRTSAVPEARVQWMKSGRTLINWTTVASGERRHYVINVHTSNGNSEKMSSLVIQSAQESDSGNYTCSADNRAGTWQSTTTLHVFKPEAMTASLNGVHVLALVMGILLLLSVFGASVLVAHRRRWFCESRPASSKDKSGVNHVGFAGDNVGQSKMVRRPLLATCRPRADGQAYARSFLENNFAVSRPDVVNVQTYECSSSPGSLTDGRIISQDDKWPPSALTPDSGLMSDEATRRPTRYALLRTCQIEDSPIDDTSDPLEPPRDKRFLNGIQLDV